MEYGDFVSNKNKIAVVGATENRSKWGYKVFKALMESGFDAVPVNPKYESVEGKICSKDISSLNGNVDLVIFVVPPKVTEQIACQVVEKGIKKAWIQPGSESKKAIETLEEGGVKVVFNACFVVDGLRKRI